jgi:hypothetical protein
LSAAASKSTSRNQTHPVIHRLTTDATQGVAAEQEIFVPARTGRSGLERIRRLRKTAGAGVAITPAQGLGV